jgi:hypothetical protein
MNHHSGINPHLMMRHYFKISIGFQYIIESGQNYVGSSSWTTLCAVEGSIWEVGSLGHASLSIIGISFICNFIDKIVPLIRCSHKALFSDDYTAAY